jgi:uncharacterized membrane protein YbaN (DUF454 family)
MVRILYAPVLLSAVAGVVMLFLGEVAIGAVVLAAVAFLLVTLVRFEKRLRSVKPS